VAELSPRFCEDLHVLKRYHDVEISNSGVWRILRRVDMSGLPPSRPLTGARRKQKRYERPIPGRLLQIDVEFIARLAASICSCPEAGWRSRGLSGVI